jgi:poly(3-hydroxybutyrate) depolymerase
MLYQTYQAHSDLLDVPRATAEIAARALAGLSPDLARHPMIRHLSATYELFAGTRLTHERPPFSIDTVMVEGREVEVREELADVTPFGSLLHFAKDGGQDQPRVLLVAPLSGHFATLLRDTVRTLLPEHDVFLTDWHNARDIVVSQGRFGFDEYIGHLIRFLEVIGPGAHVIAVCQPCVAALAATALMAQSNHPAQPRTLTLMAGPIDARVNPTKVNELATSKPISWFENTVISTVPRRYAGAGRRVYPGFLQVSAFMSMNLQRHVESHWRLYRALATGDTSGAAKTRAFYDEYFAVVDLTAEFYLETVERVFQRHLLPQGTLVWDGQPVDPRAITGTALLTVEGERDDICAAGQTVAAHDLCTGIRPNRHRHHLQVGVGHYGVFSGRRWETQIYPIVRNVIQTHD